MLLSTRRSSDANSAASSPMPPAGADGPCLNVASSGLTQLLHCVQGGRERGPTLVLSRRQEVE